MKARVLRLVPLALLLVAACVVALGSRDPSHLDPSRSWRVPSMAYPLGCGEAGVDLTAVLAHAIVRGVLLAIAVAGVGFVVGASLGASAALARGMTERIVSRACDLVQAFPSFLLALAVLSAVRTPSRVHLFFVFALTAWAPFARLALAQTRVLRSAGFVEAARALGRRPVAVLTDHILPNLLSILAVQLGASAAAIVVSEAALAFVGLGPASGVSLGSVLDQGTAAMLRAPHVLVAGSVSVMLTSVSLLIAGRAADPEGKTLD